MIEQFKKCLKRVDYYLRFLGLYMDSKENGKTIFEWMQNHRICLAHLISLNVVVTGEMFWFVDGIMSGKRFLEITHLLPCLSLCCMSNFKLISFFYYAHDIKDLVKSMESLQPDLMQTEEERDIFIRKLTGEHVPKLKNILNIIVCVSLVGLLMFGISPMFIILPHYYNTGEVKLVMPVFANYPFNEFDTRIYPWIYLHQIWAMTESLMFIFGPDSFFFTSCTFVHMDFLLLQFDMERIESETTHTWDKVKFRKVVTRHTELMRCVNLLEKIFSKSILFNALISSVIICVTGFNVLVVDNIAVMASFTAFLIFSLMQIFLFCYYGDNIVRSSMKISESIYNTKWYNLKRADRKSVLIVLIRAQRPCILTAYGFLNMNLCAFTSILSTSWSYFALLKTIYHPE